MERRQKRDVNQKKKKEKKVIMSFSYYIDIDFVSIVIHLLKKNTKCSTIDLTLT
jgi:hypothetical protein